MDRLNKAYDKVPHSLIMDCLGAVGKDSKTFGRKYENIARRIDKWIKKSGRG